VCLSPEQGEGDVVDGVDDKRDRMVFSGDGSTFQWYFTEQQPFIFQWYFPNIAVFQCYETNFPFY
jgi:hypothetical protein